MLLVAALELLRDPCVERERARAVDRERDEQHDDQELGEAEEAGELVDLAALRREDGDDHRDDERDRREAGQEAGEQERAAHELAGPDEAREERWCGDSEA